MSNRYQETLRELALDLWKVKAVTPVGGNSSISSFVLDLHTRNSSRPGPLTEVMADTAISCMRNIQREKHLECDAVATILWAGYRFAKGLAQSAGGIPFAGETPEEGIPLVRMKQMELGEKLHMVPLRKIPNSAKRILIVDDRIDGGVSKCKLIETLRDMGKIVTDVLVFIDTEQGGREELLKRNVALHSVFTITELLKVYVDAGKVGPEFRAGIQASLVLS
jgi:orotate phosphoribosyltransferase